MNPVVDLFLDRFFGSGNAISRDQAETSPDLSPLLDGLSEELGVPAVLPRRTDANEVEWFVLCGDEAALRQTQDELVAFVGPAYARWDGIRATLRASDPVEAAVSDFCDGRAIRFRTTGPTEFKECWVAIQLMRRVWFQRPAQSVEQIRTGAALVREFELAIAAGNARVAADSLGELRRRGLLGADNLRFLQIRQSAAEGRWSDIAEAGDLRDLSRIQRPWLVTEDIFTALYRTRLAVVEAAGDAARAIDVVRHVGAEFPELLASRGPLRSRDVIKLFALQFASGGNPDTDRIDELREIEGLTTDDRTWIAAIADVVRGPVSGAEPARTARDLLSEGDVDGAFALVAQDDGGPRTTELLIECAFELQTLDAAATALDALDSLSFADRELLLERRLIASAVAHLRSLAEPSDVGKPAAPRSWTEWFDRLISDPGWRAPEAVAACGELEYDAADVVDRSAAEDLAALILAAADSSRRDVVRDALPHIVGWLDRSLAEPSAARPIHVAVLTVVALDTACGDAALEVSYNSAEAVLGAGVDPEMYGELLEQLGLVWERMSARRHVPWLADLIELLELFPGPREPLIGFAAAALGPVQGSLVRVPQTTLEALRTSLGAIGAHGLTAMIPTVDVGGDTADVPTLAGKLVGIYTLTPQVGVRAKEALERRFPGVRVEVDSSHVSTPALEHLAATADYLIVAIRSAKHAATDAIDRCRPRDLPTIIPGGRGSSRMVEAFVAAVV